MTLGDKLRSLRTVEGSLRGLGRAMTQLEMVKAMKREVGKSLSQAYLSQIERGVRPHLTHTTQELLAKFFRVYPGFLVNDPPGYTRGLQSELRVADAKIDSWLYAGVGQFSSDPEDAITSGTFPVTWVRPLRKESSTSIPRSESRATAGASALRIARLLFAAHLVTIAVAAFCSCEKSTGSEVSGVETRTRW